MQCPGFNAAEDVIPANIAYDQELTKSILEYIQIQDQRMGRD